MLRAKVKEQGFSVRALANLILMSPATLKNKIEGRVEFTYQDIRLIASVLSLDGRDVLNIFFDEKVS